MSSTIVIYPIMTVLMKAEGILGQNRIWRAVNRTQALFLKAFFKRCRNEPVKIMQALQETHFTMSPEGARAKSAVAIEGICLGRPVARPLPDLIIDGPFLVWCERPGLTHPLFVGHITQEDWSNPGRVKKDAHEN